jgi:DNA-binding NtrC family response regulator
MPKKILVIDDEQDVVEFQKAYLTRKKFEVYCATTTPQAMELLASVRPDVVFCDMRIDSDRSGLDILEQAKKNDPEVAFYLITGLSDGTIEQQALAAGAREVLVKPISNEEILKRLE